MWLVKDTGMKSGNGAKNREKEGIQGMSSSGAATSSSFDLNMVLTVSFYHYFKVLA